MKSEISMYLVKIKGAFMDSSARKVWPVDWPKKNNYSTDTFTSYGSFALRDMPGHVEQQPERCVNCAGVGGDTEENWISLSTTMSWINK